MLEYALTFFNAYPVLFYILLVVAVILEGPITILAISLLADRLGLQYIDILFFAFLWDFWGDSLHFFVGRNFRNFVQNRKNIGRLKYLYRKMDSYNFFEKLLVIKYTPPITSIGLLYFWSSKISTYDFITRDALVCFISSIIISGLGYYFGGLFHGTKHEVLYLFWTVAIIMFCLFFWTKYIATFVTKRAEKKYN